VTEINVRELMLLGGRGGGGGGDGEMSAPRSRPAAQARSAAATRGPASGGTGGAAPGKEGGTEDFEDFPGALAEEDDDLPF
jgi:single-strand DNA-binding protein